jgi:hypothetical protein
MTTTRHPRLSSLIAAGAIAVAAMTALAPTANAQTEQQIKAGCDEANGTYQGQAYRDGNFYSSCCYHDYKGVQYCDFYTNGNYTQTVGPDRQTVPRGPVTGSTPPVAPPITNPPPAAR